MKKEMKKTRMPKFENFGLYSYLKIMATNEYTEEVRMRMFKVAMDWVYDWVASAQQRGVESGVHTVVELIKKKNI